MTTEATIETRSRRLTTRPIRVCHVLYRWSRCGMELQLASQLQHTDRTRIHPWIASSAPPEPFVPELPLGVAVRAFNRDAADQHFVPWLTEHLRATQTDVVHARGLWMLLPALQAAHAAGGVPLVFSFHGFDDATFAPSWLRRRMWRTALGCCSAVITVSEPTRDAFAATLDMSPQGIQVIHNGVDLERFVPSPDRAAARARLRLSDDRPTLLCVGSLMRVKGQDVLINALARLGPRACRALFVGTDHLNGALQRRTAIELSGMDVRFVGNVEDVRPYLWAADLIVAPSRSEGFSNAILEAMAAGLPVVATSVGGTLRLVDDGRTGWLAPPEDPAALALAIKHALSDPDLRQRRGSAGRLHVEHSFDLRRAVELYASVYYAVAARRNAPA